MANVIDKKRIRGLSERLLEAHSKGDPFFVDEPLFLESPDEAYWVQEVVLRGLDPRRPIAWKISPPKDGAQPFGSPTPFSGLRVSPATFDPGNRCLGVEAEIAFRFGEAPIRKGKRSDIEGAVEEAFVLIELCETRFANWDLAPALCRIADFQSHGGFALGSGTREWRSVDFARQPVELWVNGTSVVSRTGSHPSRDPFELVAWAATHCAERGMPLAAGDIVTTGTWTGLTPVRAGDEVLARFEGIGAATLRMAG